nr:MarR family winged helix-turn-helix transcriptional regulator [Streptomyces sp. NBC_00886]
MTTATTPRANGRTIALAHYAGRAVLESVLTRHGLVFQQQITLRLVAVADGPVGRDHLVEEVVSALKTDKAAIHTVVDELIRAKLLEAEASHVRITDTGREMYDRVTTETNVISTRIYADIPTEDLETAGRALALVTERANAELAAVAR